MSSTGITDRNTVDTGTGEVVSTLKGHKYGVEGLVVGTECVISLGRRASSQDRHNGEGLLEWALPDPGAIAGEVAPRAVIPLGLTPGGVARYIVGIQVRC